MTEHLSDIDVQIYCLRAVGDGAIRRIEEHLPQCVYCSRRVNETARAIAVEQEVESSRESERGVSTPEPSRE